MGYRVASLALVIVTLCLLLGSRAAAEGNLYPCKDPAVKARVNSVMLKFGHDAGWATVYETIGFDAWADENGVYITRALVDFCQTDDELASILGHQIAHHKCSHFLQAQIENDKKWQAIGAVAKPILRVGGDMGDVLVAGTVVKLLYPDFSKEFEYEADEVSMQLLCQSGYNPHAMVGLFEKMHDKYNDMKGDLKMRIFNNPPFKERIERLKKIEEQIPVYPLIEKDMARIEPAIFALAIGKEKIVPPGYQIMQIGKKDYHIWLFIQSATKPVSKKGVVILPVDTQELVFYLEKPRSKKKWDMASLSVGRCQCAVESRDVKAVTQIAFRVSARYAVTIGTITIQNGVNWDPNMKDYGDIREQLKLETGKNAELKECATTFPVLQPFEIKDPFALIKPKAEEKEDPAAKK